MIIRVKYPFALMAAFLWIFLAFLLCRNGGGENRFPVCFWF